MTTTTPEARKACPPSAVHDQIVRWDEVREGELVLHDGELRLAERRMLSPSRPERDVAVRLNGDGSWLVVPRDRLTAVRRYMEG